MGVYFHTLWNKSDMQWPCSSGFHIPTTDEWETLNTMWQTLWAWDSSNPNNLSINLKMPFTWWCDENFWNLYNEWNRISFWSAEHWASGKGKLLFTASTTNISSWSDYTINRWACIRPFKDTSVVPDSSWTKTYSWTWDAWIYHNSTLWLLSISSDGDTRITIADKNLWATVVYNNWDTLSQNNCWKFYQRWNNYGFAHSWAGTTSSTQVDASAYWPWNYYSSSTFITWQPRDTSDNYNLWWWVSGMPAQKELQNAYIWEYVPSFVYTYDFRNKSATDITNAWWTIYWDATQSSDGIYCPQYTDLTMLYPIDASTASKITMEWEIKFRQLPHICAAIMWLQVENIKYSDNNVVFYVASSTNYGWIRVRLSENGVTTDWTNIWWIGTDTYTIKLEIDLANKIVTWSIAGYSNSTLSLSDAQVSLIRSTKYIKYYVTEWTFYLQSIKTTII